MVICDNDEDELMFATIDFNATELFEVVASRETGDDLLAFLSHQSKEMLPDLLLLDLNMPGRSGFDILNTLSKDKKFHHIPVYISSTSSNQSTIDKCRRLGARGYLKKPDLFDRYTTFAEQLFTEFQKLKVPV